MPPGAPRPWVPLTREAVVGGSRPEEVVWGMSSAALGLSFLLQLPPTAPPSLAGFWRPLPHPGFRLPSLVPCPPSLAPPKLTASL